jgi:DNA polymerase elongation subunit (family B)
VPDENGEHTTLFGEKCAKVLVNKFWLTKEKIQMYDRTFESDLSYVKRFLVDYGHEFVSESEPRIMFFDIETTSLEPEDGMIISIVAYDSYTKEYTEFVHGPDLPISTERDLLLSFSEYISETQPDIYSGWFSNTFDIPYLLNRMEANNIAIGKLSPMNRVDRWIGIKGQETIKIRGVALIDLLDAYKKMSNGELESYKLDFVAEKELGEGKHVISKLPGKLWDEGSYSELLLYNRIDVEILAKLDEKLGIIQYLNKVSQIASCDLSDTLYNSRIIDSYFLKRATERDIVLPSRNFGRTRANYTGAFVVDSINGVHEKVGVYDFSSLYPSLITSHDISPETIQTRDSGTSYAVVRGDEPGFIPSILDDILDLRKEYKKRGEDNNQRVMKEIANSCYGAMALPSFRLYTPQMAAMITEKGREIIQRMINVSETEKYKIVAGDTDSIMLSGIESREEGEQLEIKLNKAVEKYAEEQGIIDNRLHIEFEAYATRAIFAGKKRYGMKLDDGTYKIRGFQLVRSDSQQKTKELQEEIIHKILDGASDKDIRNYYNAEKDKIISGNSLKGLAIPRKFTKPLSEYANNIAVKAAQFSNKEFNKNISSGDKVIFYHIKQSPTGTLAIALDLGEKLPDGYIVDVKKHWNRINKAIKPLLDDLGILEKTKQNSLDAFF